MTTAGGFWQANQTGTTATTNVSGGLLSIAGNINLAERGTGVFNVSGGGEVMVGTLAMVGYSNSGTGANGTFNLLSGGTLAAGTISLYPGQTSYGTGTFNFNGGVLVASGNNVSFMTGISAATVQDNGGAINNGGYNITIGQALAHGGISSTDGGLVFQGSGTTTLTGANSYNGGTTINAGALAFGANNALPASGVVTLNNGASLNLSGYSASLGAVTLASGSIASIPAGGALTATSYNVQSGAIGVPLGGASAALTQTGHGLVTLTAANTYGGGTIVSGGTLQLGDGLSNNGSVVGNITDDATLVFANPSPQQFAGAISGTGSVSENGTATLTLSGSNSYSGPTNVNAGTLVVNGSLAAGGTVTLAAGTTLSGSGSVGMTTLAGSATVDVSQNPANRSLTLAGLILGSNETINFGAFANYTSVPAISAGTVTTSGRSTVSLNFPNGYVPNGIYDLLSFNTVSGYGLGAFTLANGGPSGLGGRQSASLIHTGSMLEMDVTGDYPVWTGANGTAWVGQNNWVLAYAKTVTDFETGDAVQFSDTAGSNAVVNTTVNISSGNVFPANVAFNNNVLSYTVTGANGIAGTCALVVSGSGTVTIANSNSYSGGTYLNAGRLNVNNPAALGSGTLTINGGRWAIPAGDPLRWRPPFRRFGAAISASRARTT